MVCMSARTQVGMQVCMYTYVDTSYDPMLLLW